MELQLFSEKFLISIMKRLANIIQLSYIMAERPMALRALSRGHFQPPGSVRAGGVRRRAQNRCESVISEKGVGGR